MYCLFSAQETIHPVAFKMSAICPFLDAVSVSPATFPLACVLDAVVQPHEWALLALFVRPGFERGVIIDVVPVIVVASKAHALAHRSARLS